MKAYLHLNTFDGRATILDLAHTHSDEFVADDSSKEAFSSRVFYGDHEW